MTQVANFDYQYDYSPVVLWQYSNSPNIKGIIDNEQIFINKAITQFRDEFDEDIFNLKTCNSDGLDLWGRLLGVQRPLISGVIATDEQYRLLLLVRFSLLTWDGSCPGLTKTIRNIFPKATFSVEDCPLDDQSVIQRMTARINFAGGLTEEEKDILTIGYTDPTSSEFVYTFLPRPAGVLYDIEFVAGWNTILGFEGMTETTNMGGAYNCDPGDETGETGTENPDGGVFYK